MKIDKQAFVALKANLKALANKIHQLKSSRKAAPFGYVLGLSSAQEDFRTQHIAYCLLRGRTIEQIENRRLTHPPYDSVETRLIWGLKQVWKKLTGGRFCVVRGMQPVLSEGV